MGSKAISQALLKFSQSGQSNKPNLKFMVCICHRSIISFLLEVFFDFYYSTSHHPEASMIYLFLKGKANHNSGFSQAHECKRVGIIIAFTKERNGGNRKDGDANCQSHFLALKFFQVNSVKDKNASYQVPMGDRLLFLLPNFGWKALVRLLREEVCRGASKNRPLYTWR